MKTILCYGDSNTHGYDPSTGLRYPPHVRWTGVLRGLLGSGFLVIEEGCNGRTTVFTDPEEGWKNGLDYLKPCLNSHKPIDLVILMLGSNDLKRFTRATAADSADGAGKLADVIHEFLTVKQGYAPKILLAAPPRIRPEITESPFRLSFDENASAMSERFAEEFRRVAREKGCFFFDAASVAEASPLDSLHLGPDDHRKLAEALCGKVRELLD